jgi:ssDNA thymidine ADP-ribosyltransferase, DarT
MDTALSRAVEDREITRLCHLTPTRNLVHIATGKGLAAVKDLTADERAVFTAQDLHRFDRHPGHLSCSIEYPNAWYLRRKKTQLGEAANFRDWVVLGIKPDCLLREDTLFSAGNAAAGGGAGLQSGIEGFAALFADTVTDGAGRTFRREQNHLRACPTNEQAEVMVYAGVPLEEVTTIFLADTEQAARVYEGLKQIGAEAGRFRYVIAPEFFNPYQLSKKLRNGIDPTEVKWKAPG